ncbi:hypothetical protein BDV38DRAFT_296836 [Aspergillus pseudotamarii]|uniref:DUF7136 domain-containing protein n=1 Tax=Aspergillus pseudotamarii TaxID=132259 RepID=A0A5N6T4T3_ASPPS|nr:uncharacterized protein BDV38DRAFT_296836 [Aspergillus pseudotamarii]KAE8141323.1 hypothetical protein BDV38DRAFT_296836 [Aspergillus pseudotamarii]
MATTTLLFSCFILLNPSLAQEWPYTPQTIELDLVFPRNDTYAPIDYFPLILGLQNAKAAWPQGIMIDWKLEQLDTDMRMEEGYFPPHEPQYYLGGSYNTRNEPPSDPFIYFHFPFNLRNFTSGHWRYSWRFGFAQNCTAPQATSERWFLSQPRQEVVFRTAAGGRPVDLLDPRDDCFGEPVTFEIVDWTRTLWTDLATCPILNETAPKPNPCALQFEQTDVGNITAAIEADKGCKPGSLANITDISISSVFDTKEK